MNNTSLVYYYMGQLERQDPYLKELQLEDSACCSYCGAYLEEDEVGVCADCIDAEALRLAKAKEDYEYSHRDHDEAFRAFHRWHYSIASDMFKRHKKKYNSNPSNAGKLKAHSFKRRALLANTKSIVSSYEIQDLIESADECFWCGKSLEDGYHIDHFYPISRGGDNSIENLVVSCPHCNLSKGAKDPLEFAKVVGKDLAKEESLLNYYLLTLEKL
jgi:5-methylcytosine-specific restriction endonuclease McrA